MNNQNKQEIESEMKRLDSIWEKLESELFYWVREYIGPMEAKNISIHQIDRGGGGETTILYDMDDKSAILMNTDTTARTPDDSYSYMMIEPKVLAKLVEVSKTETNIE